MAASSVEVWHSWRQERMYGQIFEESPLKTNRSRRAVRSPSMRGNVVAAAVVVGAGAAVA